MARIVLPETPTGMEHHVEDVLRERLPGDTSGPSRFGWHAISHFMRCPRLAYWDLVRGLRPRRPRFGIDVGTLMHASRELHYGSGGARAGEAIQACQDACPTAAAEATRLLRAYLAKYAAHEAATWDLRAIEHAAEAWVKAKPIFGGRAIRFPISCRYDLIVRKREAGEAPLPTGPCPTGVVVDELKNLSALTRDAIAGYGMDGQLLMQALLWREAKLDQVFGPLNGFVVNVVVRTKEPKLERIEARLTAEEVDVFAASMLPWAAELWRRLAAPEKYPIEAWPLNHAGCQSRWGLCFFFDLCESRGTMLDLYEAKPAHAARVEERAAGSVKPPRAPRARRPRQAHTAPVPPVAAAPAPSPPGACEDGAVAADGQFQATWLRTRCSICAEVQFVTPGGPSCKNGHGGASALALDAVPADEGQIEHGRREEEATAETEETLVEVPSPHDACTLCGVVFDGRVDYVDADGACTSCKGALHPVCPGCGAAFGVGVRPAWITDEGLCKWCGRRTAAAALRSIESRWETAAAARGAAVATTAAGERRARLV